MLRRDERHAARRDRARASARARARIHSRRCRRGFDHVGGENGVACPRTAPAHRDRARDPEGSRFSSLDEATSRSTPNRSVSAGGARHLMQGRRRGHCAPPVDRSSMRPHRRPRPGRVVEQGTHAELLARGASTTAAPIQFSALRYRMSPPGPPKANSTGARRAKVSMSPPGRPRRIPPERAARRYSMSPRAAPRANCTGARHAKVLHEPAGPPQGRMHRRRSAKVSYEPSGRRRSRSRTQKHPRWGGRRSACLTESAGFIERVTRCRLCRDRCPDPRRSTALRSPASRCRSAKAPPAAPRALIRTLDRAPVVS